MARWIQPTNTYAVLGPCLYIETTIRSKKTTTLRAFSTHTLAYMSPHSHTPASHTIATDSPFLYCSVCFMCVHCIGVSPVCASTDRMHIYSVRLTTVVAHFNQWLRPLLGRSMRHLFNFVCLRVLVE